jgi:hypothetical protein
LFWFCSFGMELIVILSWLNVGRHSTNYLSTTQLSHGW